MAVPGCGAQGNHRRQRRSALPGTDHVGASQHCFPDGDNLLDAFDVYTADHNGALTRKTERDPKGDGWFMADLQGMALTNPGFDAWHFKLVPEASDASGKRWKLSVAVRRSPEPIRR